MGESVLAVLALLAGSGLWCLYLAIGEQLERWAERKRREDGDG